MHAPLLVHSSTRIQWNNKKHSSATTDRDKRRSSGRNKRGKLNLNLHKEPSTSDDNYSPHPPPLPPLCPPHALSSFPVLFLSPSPLFFLFHHHLLSAVLPSPPRCCGPRPAVAAWRFIYAGSSMGVQEAQLLFSTQATRKENKGNQHREIKGTRKHKNGK